MTSNGDDRRQRRREYRGLRTGTGTPLVKTHHRPTTEGGGSSRQGAAIARFECERTTGGRRKGPLDVGQRGMKLCEEAAETDTDKDQEGRGKERGRGKGEGRGEGEGKRKGIWELGIGDWGECV